MNHGAHGLIRIEGTHAFYPAVREQRERVVAHHAFAMTWTGPRGQPATLIRSIEQALQDLGIHFGIEKIVERLRSAKGVPETTVGIKHSGMNLAVIRTEVS